MTHSPPRLARWTIIFLFVLMALGLPALAALAFPKVVPSVRWLAVLGLIGYEAGVVVLAFVAFPDYERRYRRFVRRQHGALTLKAVTPRGALKLDLEGLYTPLTLDARFINQSPHTLLRMLPGQLRQGDHSIWDFLSLRGLTGQSFVVVGEPGSGKTTLLQHIAVSLAAQRHEVPLDCRDLLPVMLSLHEHIAAIRANARVPLAQVIGDHLTRRQAPAPPAGWIEEQLEKGNCLILMDGLNEIADPELRPLFRTWVKSCVVAHPRNRFIISSRTQVYRAMPFNDMLTLEIRAFSRKQTEHLTRQWLRARSRRGRGVTAPAVLASLAAGPLRALAGNPLSLTLLLNLRQRRDTVPPRQAEIYTALLALAPESRKLPIAQRQRLLQRLAYSMMCTGQLEISGVEAASVMAPLLLALDVKEPPEAVLKKLARSTGVLVRSSTGGYGFAHLAFQEYLAAAHVAENELQTELVTQASDLWWHETQRLYCALSDAAAAVAGLLRDDNASPATLALALECLDEVHEVRPAIWAYCQATLREVLDGEDAQRRKWVGEGLLRSRLRRLASQEGDWAKDDSLITCAEYQIFLDEQRPESQFYQPDHWPGYRYPAGHGLRPVVGMRPDDAAAFCAWLTEREPGEWAYRLPTAHEVRSSARLAETAAGLGYWTATPAGERSGEERVIVELAWVDGSRPLGISEIAVTEKVEADLTRDLLHLTADDLPRDMECRQLLAEALALGRDLDHDLGHAQDPNHDLEGAQALAHDLAIALGVDLGLDMDIEFELARDRERNLGYDLSLAREPDPGPDADAAQRLTQAREAVRRRPGTQLYPRLAALDLTPAQPRSQALAAKLERLADADGVRAAQLEPVLQHNLSLALDRDLDRDLALALDSDRALANALALKLHRVHNLKLERALRYARELREKPEHEADKETLSRIVQLIETRSADGRVSSDWLEARDLALSLDLHLAAALELARAQARNRDRAGQLAQRLATARDLARDQGRRRNRGLARLVFLINALLTQPAPSPDDDGMLEKADLERQQLSSRYLELYLDFVTLEGRVSGDLPPFEGICLTRVRAEDTRRA